MPSLRAFASRPNYSDFGPSHGLQTPVETGAELLGKWRRLLGEPALPQSTWAGPAEKVGELELPDFTVTTYLQPSGPGGLRQRVAILHPRHPAGSPAPCAVLPFYQAERLVGLELGAFEGEARLLADPKPQDEVLRFGEHLARLGLVVACVEAFPYNLVGTPEGDPFSRWPQGAAKLLAENPGWSGIGKLVADTSLALDLLLSQPGVDASRVLSMGHSLGGKMAFYTGALDARVTAVVASDFGLPWRSTNWAAAWYHGEERVARAEREGMAHHELLALLAPRPFLLLAGEADNAAAWQYLEAARPWYAKAGVPENLGCIDHASGHRPPLCSVDLAYGWLAEVFGLPHRRWRAS